MIGLSVCTGIGAPEVSAPWIDWRYQSEIEPFPSAVLAHRFPHAVNLGDMTRFKEWPDATVDVLVGGTPCQSFSVAGLRRGLDDPRGNLMLTYLAIARRYRPRWLVFENVPGLLSADGGRAFGTFLRGLGELGYGFAYRVLDAQYVRASGFSRAVPQRRRRVFVVGYLGDWRRAAAVLFDGESLRGNPPPRREAGQIAPTIPARSLGGGGLGTDFDCDGGLITLTDGFEVCGALSDGAHNGGGLNGQDAYTGRILPVAHALRGEGFDASEDGAAYTLEARTVTQAVAFDTTQITSPGNYSKPKAGDPCHPLAAGAHAPAVAFSVRADAMREGTAKTLSPDAEGKMRLRDPGIGIYEEIAPTLDTGQAHGIVQPWAVRRLTPLECERLQGFPDGWTAIPYRNKPADACPDGPRYKALGNSWAVNCGRVIFDRMRMVEERWPAERMEAAE